jgi:hypothetical protein
MATQALIGIPGTTQSLDATSVSTSLGTGLREAVFIADPTTTAARAAVTNSNPPPDSYALLTRNVGMTFDAFNRLRVSNPATEFSGFNEYKINPFNYVTATAGTGTVTHSTTTKRVTLATGGTVSGARAVLQTKSYMRYNPGKSLATAQTFTLGAAPSANVAKRVGYFDDSNGLFLEYTSTGIRFVRRSSVSGSVVDTAFEQANWNVDPMNGTGPSGLTLNLDYSQIFWIDLQFLGVGTVRYGFEINGTAYVCHAANHANLTSSQPYIATANLPLRWELVNTGTAGATATMDCICGKVDSEGGLELPSIQYAVSNGVTGIATSTTLKPILSIRPGPTFGGITNRGWMLPQTADFFVTGTSNHYYQIILNATLTGPSWTAVNTNAMAQYDVTSSAVALGTGVVIEDGYIASGAKTGSAFASTFSGRPLVNSFDGTTPDTLTIAVRTLTGTDTGFGSFTWFGYW